LQISASLGEYASERFGIINVNRPEAVNVYNLISGTEESFRSEPTQSNSPLYTISSKYAYMWLHGDWKNPGSFCGESSLDGQHIQAITVSNLQEPTPHVVFNCACWGGLHTDVPGFHQETGINQLNTEESLAINFLARGTAAYIGCTGVHYSPIGKSLHEAFWNSFQSGNPPALALLKAKEQFRESITDTASGYLKLAISHKIWRIFTCLGLGW
jgi:hypothetical protein